MIYDTNATALVVFLIFVGAVLGFSFYLGRKAKSSSGYFAAHGQVGWFVNGVAFAGDYLSAASFLGICGLIAFYGYDGFLYSIGFLAGWVVALFVIAEPIKRLGKYTFADALDAQFGSRAIKLTAAISTLVVSVFYLIPQMVGAGTLIQPLLGIQYIWGVVIVGTVVTLIVVTAGMVSTTWVQFIKGSLLVIFCGMLTIAILASGLIEGDKKLTGPTTVPAGATKLELSGTWVGQPYERWKLANGEIETYRVGKDASLTLAQEKTKTPDGTFTVRGLPQGHGEGKADLHPVGHVQKLPDYAKEPGNDHTGPLGPVEYIGTIMDSTIVTWSSQSLKDAEGNVSTVYFQVPKKGEDLLLPGEAPLFKNLKSNDIWAKLDFISLMLALFAGTASLPHILIRYYTVKDAAAARKSTLVGIATIGFFYVLTLYLGLGAMTSGRLDPTNNNMSAPMLAAAFGKLPFAFISAIAFTTVLGTVSGLILAATGAIAHDLAENVMRIKMRDETKVLVAKVATVFIGIIAMVLGVAFEKFNASFLVGWAFNVAASANLPSLVMLLFWRRTTKYGITAAITVGLLSSLGWLLVSAPAFQFIYGYTATDAAKAALVPFSQPGLVTIPLGFAVLVAVSLVTTRKRI